jgi:diaminopimelate decarboxylase
VGRPLAPPDGVVDIAGNINEANDVFARARPMPTVKEGDILAFLPAGAYGSSMASDHCLRGEFGEKLIDH